MPNPRIPRSVEYATAIFDEMKKEADEDGVWTGKMTELHHRLGIPSNYYSPVMKLIAEEAATQVERGGAGKPSVWNIVDPEATFLPPDNVNALPRQHRTTLKGRVEELERNTGGLNIPELISSMNIEIEILKRQVAELRGLPTEEAS